MQIQFDPLSFVVALIAVGVSARAYYLAKRAPHDARLRQHRDELRAALRGAQQPFFDASFALDRGMPVPEIPEAVVTAYEKVKEVGPRLPENLRMWSMQTAFDAVTDRWRAVKWTQQRADSAASEVDKWEAESLERGTHERVLEVARKNLLSARKELADASTARDAARLSLREALQPAREQVKGYVEELDRMDRRPK